MSWIQCTSGDEDQSRRGTRGILTVVADGSTAGVASFRLHGIHDGRFVVVQRDVTDQERLKREMESG
jgi:hypothetical protein